ncbi:MAG: fumarate reductase (quinol) flavoprotein subunit [Deltaproteobacteria bacterium]|nr:fumarate reductase (quinol) flavoprotein subunit [Deltaproteobacteria bacterium]
MEVIKTDIAILGAGGGGLRAAIAVAEANPTLHVALISKVYPMRSHTVAAEGGAAGVAQDIDSLDNHFNDTVTGGDWLCDQDMVEMFVKEAPRQLTRIEQWGCPWSRDDDGSVSVRKFGGMKVARTWYAADKTGFHMLHTLFQTSIQFESIHRFDEFYATDLMIDDGRCQGVTAIEMRTGQMKLFLAKAVIIAAGGAGQIFPFTTNGSIKTADGMAMAYRAGVPLRDMEFIQYHPTGLPGTGILLTEGCRGEGGVLRNKDGYRYLQDYEMGPETPLGDPQPKTMELGPRDRLSQAFYHEQKKGRTVETIFGDAVHLDMTHLGEKKIEDRLPMVRMFAKTYIGVDMVKEPVPVRPVVHYTMGGIKTDLNGATLMQGLYALGECASSGLHGANRLGSNSLTELTVMGLMCGENAAGFAKEQAGKANESALEKQAADAEERVFSWVRKSGGGERPVTIRKEMHESMEQGVGIYREAGPIKATCDKIAELRDRYPNVQLEDRSNVYNTDLFSVLELGNLLDVAQTLSDGALARTESRGAHQRLDHPERDDENFLQHTLAYYSGKDAPRIEYEPVVITRSQPAERAYGGKAKNG